MQLTGTGIWSTGFRSADAGAITDAAAELEELGYTSLWLPDAGGDLFGAVERLLAPTRNIVVATGVLNLWMHTAETTAEAHARLTDQYGDRFLVGIGVSHSLLIDPKFGDGSYRQPMAQMNGYLDALDVADVPLARDTRVLAALGPRMTELAGLRSAGVHPYNTTAEHTARAREILGPSALVLPEQAVTLASSADEGRRVGRAMLMHYLAMPNYANNFRRMGFTEDDFAGEGSDRFVDAIVAWGNDDAIATRVREHRDAGADHVCVQVLSAEGPLPIEAWRTLAPALTTA